MQVAPTTQITFDLYGKLCNLSKKFKELFNKGTSEPQPAYAGQASGYGEQQSPAEIPQAAAPSYDPPAPASALPVAKRWNQKKSSVVIAGHGSDSNKKLTDL